MAFRAKKVNVTRDSLNRASIKEVFLINFFLDSIAEEKKAARKIQSPMPSRRGGTKMERKKISNS